MSTISFSRIPSNLRVPGTYFEIDPSRANTAQQQLRTLIVGQVLAGSAYAAAGAAGVVQISAGPADAALKAGYGSMLALMVAQSRISDSFGEIWVLPLVDDPAAVAASGTIAFAGTATVTGTLPLYVAGVNVPVLTPQGMTAAQLAAAAVAAVNALPNLPVTATASGANATLVAKNRGLVGNSIDIRMAYRGALAGETVPAGISASITAMSGGTQNPSLALPFAQVPSNQTFEVVACPYTDGASLDAVAALMNDSTGRWSWQSKTYGHCYAFYSGILGAATTFGVTRNDQHTSVLCMANSPMWPPVAAADYAACVMSSVRADPALPLQNIPTNILAPAVADQFQPVDRQTLLYDGLSTYKLVNGAVVLERVVTTYQKNAAGVVDTAYLDAETMHCLGYICRDLDSYLTTSFARVKLTADNVKIPGGSALVNPAVIKATLDTRYRYLCESVQIAQDPDGFAAESRVELAGPGTGRVDIYAPVRVMGQLRIMAIKVAFTKPT